MCSRNLEMQKRKTLIDYTERNVFEAEWFDKVASTLRKFYLYHYPADNTLELFDLKTRKTFLRRTNCDGVEAKDLYVGAMVNIFSRCMKITSFANSATKKKLAATMQRTFAMLKPDVIDKMGEILKKITSHNFHIGNVKMVNLTRDEATEFYADSKDQSQLPFILNYITSGPVLALELVGQDGISRWHELVGPVDSSEAREKAPASFRACYGKDSLFNAIHGSDAPETAERELNFFFHDAKTRKNGLKNTATLKNCTCCVIKPHALQAKLIGHIIDDIQKAGYTITAIQQFYVDPVNVEEFLEIYKGVLPDYGAMVSELQSGPCIAMEITHKDESIDVPKDFRKLCGPMDPEIARQLRPETLRAKYGKSKVQNAVHCSDLPEDGLLEVEYFFKILADN